MKGKSWRIVHPSAPRYAPRYAPLIFLLLVVLTLAAAPVAAQSRPSCKNDAYVMGWDEDAASGTGFTMTRDCNIKTGSDNNPLLVKSGKTFIIDGAGFTIYPADKASANDQGTAITLVTGAGTLVLRNVTIDGGGDAATPTGGDADPAIIVNDGNLILDGVTIQNTRGGAILVRGVNSKVIFKNSIFTGNQATGSTAAFVITIPKGDNLYVVGLLTMKDNTGDASAIYEYTNNRIDLYDAGCLDLAGNVDSDGEPANIAIAAEEFAAGFTTIWGDKRKGDSNACDGNTASVTTRPQGFAAPPTIPTATSTATVPAAPAPAPANVGGSGGQMTTDDKNGQCLLGTVGSHSVYCIARFDDGTVLLQIYRVDDNSVGHWVMNVSQAAIDAVSGAGCVAASPDGRYAVRVWADGNITIYDGPDHESKVFHNTLKGGVSKTVLETLTTYSSTPPGMGCPGFIWAEMKG